MNSTLNKVKFNIQEMMKRILSLLHGEMPIKDAVIAGQRSGRRHQLTRKISVKAVIQDSGKFRRITCFKVKTLCVGMETIINVQHLEGKWVGRSAPVNTLRVNG
jgi:hypothetical protein